MLNNCCFFSKPIEIIIGKINRLKNNQMLTLKDETGKLTMYFSADIEKAKQMTELILNTDQAEFSLINLADY